MKSFNYQIDHYTKEITNFINNKSLNGSSSEKSKLSSYLTTLFSTLKEAPIYHVNSPSVKQFIGLVDRCQNLADANDSVKACQVAKKINFWLYTLSTSDSYFQGPKAQDLNTILDKNTEDMQEQEYNLLSQFITVLAFQYNQYHKSYIKSAIINKIEQINILHPDIKFVPGESDNNYGLCLRIQELDTEDLAFACFLKFHLDNNPQFSEDHTFIKTIIQNKARSTDLKFKNSMSTCLGLCVMLSLGDQWDHLHEGEEKASELEARVTDALSYFWEFQTVPSSYKKFYTIHVNPYEGTKPGFCAAAKELFSCNEKKFTALDQWYKGIYTKISAYQKEHPHVVLPSTTPSVFKSYLNFVNPSDLNISLLTQIKQWEKEAEQQELKKKQPFKKSSPKPKASRIQKPHFRPNQAHICAKEDTAPVEKPQLEEPSPSLPPVAAPPPLISVPVPKEKALDQLLRESSPFAVTERVTKWFIPNSNLPLLDEESPLIHNFAWAANTVLWQFGLRYKREKDHGGGHEPALAMLCQVEHALFAKRELFRITATFAHPFDSSEEYDPSWNCYHRTLTRRAQEQETVEDYIATGKDLFVDFPALPSQRLQIEVPDEWLGKIYPDGSFIEAVEGSVIRIRDPKNDTSTKKCHLYLFVVR